MKSGEQTTINGAGFANEKAKHISDRQNMKAKVENLSCSGKQNVPNLRSATL